MKTTNSDPPLETWVNGKLLREIRPEDSVVIRGGEKFITVKKQAPAKTREQMRDERIDLGIEQLPPWGYGPMVLQSNDHSRLHKLAEYVADVLEEEFDGTACKTFVVKHDWVRAFGQELGKVLPEELILPFPSTAFEFRVSGRPVTAIALDNRDSGGELSITILVECPNGHWAALGAAPDEQTEGMTRCTDLVHQQINAICVMLDSKVAEYDVVRQPQKLQQKRQRTGKLPLHDYHVVDLSSRYRSKKAVSTDGGWKMRCHFRRGHWTHEPEQPLVDQARHPTAQRWKFHDGRWRTWVNWVLAGDPDLGVVDKEYRL